MLFKLILLFCVAARIAASNFEVNENTNAADLWEQYKTEFKRNYDENEDKIRFEIFKESVELVREHNAKYARGETTYTLGINQFSDRRSHEVHRGILKPKLSTN